MSSVNWNNSHERKAYYRQKGEQYRANHPRVTVTYTQEEFKWVDESAKHYGVQRVSHHIKKLSVEAAKIGLGEQVERPPQVPEEVVDEMLYLLHNCSNNINQIAYNLNSRALEHNVRPVTGEAESRRIIDELHALLRDTKSEIKSLTSQAKS